jgi:excisionase family DNA binding protein
VKRNWPPLHSSGAVRVPIHRASSSQKEVRQMAWLTVVEVCERLQISRNTWDKWRSDGRGPRCKKLPNGQLRIRADWLDQWLEELEAA